MLPPLPILYGLYACDNVDNCERPLRHTEYYHLAIPSDHGRIFVGPIFHEIYRVVFCEA